MSGVNGLKVANLVNQKRPTLSSALYAVLPYLQDQTSLSNDIRQRFLVSVSSAGVVPLCLYFAYLDFASDRLPTGILQSVVAITAAICFLLSRTSHYHSNIPRGLLLLVIFSMFSNILLDRGTSTLFYLFIIPPTAFFLFGVREGLAWTMITFISAALILQNSERLGLHLSHVSIDFVVTYLDLTLLSAGFESLRYYAERNAEIRNRELLDEHQQLIHAQQELASSEQRFRSFSELASDWLFEMDKELNYTFASPKLSEILGRDIQGKNIRNLAIELEGEGSAFSALRGGADIHNQEVRFKNYRGERVMVLFSAKTRRDEAGNFIGYIGAGKDITKIQNAQEELRLKDQSLHHIQKLEALGQLTSGVAHDFNNLLTVISGNLELLDSNPMETEQGLINSAQRAVSRAAGLTNQLLSFSRKQDLKPRAINVPELLDRLTDMCTRTMGSSISIQRDIAPELYPCLADESQLESAILNLAINARDAMSGNGEIIFRASNYYHDITNTELELIQGDYICIAVVDHGVGIDPLQSERIMEPFFTTKPSGEGTGLGLSMVFGFASQSGGTLEVQSTVGMGAIFNLYLPRATVLKIAPTQQEVDQKQLGNKRRVLLVEDDPDVRQVLENNLTHFGYIVTLFDNAEAALENLSNVLPNVLSKVLPDVVITDLMLGKGMNGVDLANQLRRSHPQLPTLLISGNADHLLSEEDMLRFANFLLRKPFSARQLHDAINGLLTEERSQ
tara:strand:+ start:16229 stop:18433 length:2205 start_codon:yes stop_codon:yes gene_type:complete